MATTATPETNVQEIENLNEMLEDIVKEGKVGESWLMRNPASGTGPVKKMNNMVQELTEMSKVILLFQMYQVCLIMEKDGEKFYQICNILDNELGEGKRFLVGDRILFRNKLFKLN